MTEWLRRQTLTTYTDTGLAPMMIISNDDEDNDNHGNYDSDYDAKGEGFDSTHSADSQQNTHTTPTRGKLPNIEAKDDGTEDEDENDDDNHSSRGETHENNNTRV